jgi:hypothetical protein
MEIIQQLSLVAFHQVLGDRAESILSFLDDRFGDSGQRLTRAVHTANVRAWKSLEIALAGNSWWNSCKNLLASRAEQGFRQQIQSFLDTIPLPQLPGGEGDFRERCLKELKAAGKAGLVPGERVPTDALARQTRALASCANPENILHAELQAVEGMAQSLRQGGFPHLSQYVSLQPPEGKPLLVVAVRYFFRREVELDPKLSQGLTFQQLEGLSANQEAGFRELHDALLTNGEKLEGLLDGVYSLVADTRQDVQAMRAEVQRLGDLLDRDTQDSGTEEVRLLRAQLEQQSQQIQQLVSFVSQAMETRSAPVPPHPPARSPQPPAPSPLVGEGEPGTVPEVPHQPTIQTGVPTSPLLGEGSNATPTATGWNQVRELLGRCRSVSHKEQDREPEWYQAVDQLERATQAYESTRRTLLQIGDIQENDPILDALPVDAPLVPESPDSASSPGRPALRRVQGPLVSSLFQQPNSEDKANPEDPPSPASEGDGARGQPMSKLLSPLFTQPPSPQPSPNPGEKGSEEAQAPPPPEEKGKKKRFKGLSPLFGGPQEEPDEREGS